MLQRLILAGSSSVLEERPGPRQEEWKKSGPSCGPDAENIFHSEAARKTVALRRGAQRRVEKNGCCTLFMRS